MAPLRVFDLALSLKGRLAGLIAVLLLVLCGTAIAGPETPTLQAGQTFRDCSGCPEMVVIPAGSFAMGSSTAETTRDLESVPGEELP